MYLLYCWNSIKFNLILYTQEVVTQFITYYIKWSLLLGNTVFSIFHFFNICITPQGLCRFIKLKLIDFIEFPFLYQRLVWRPPEGCQRAVLPTRFCPSLDRDSSPIRQCSSPIVHEGFTEPSPSQEYVLPSPYF